MAEPTRQQRRHHWKSRLSQQMSGFHFNTCMSVNIVQEDEEKVEQEPATTTAFQKRQLWRKPLPQDCPQFDFSQQPLNEKTEIPTRDQSKHYDRLPNLEAELDRACKNEKAVFLANLLSQQQRH